jgi:hypothetical protein
VQRLKRGYYPLPIDEARNIRSLLVSSATYLTQPTLVYLSARLGTDISSETHAPRLVRGQSISQRSPGARTQNRGFTGVPRAWW